jgi:hypothetical protein
MSFAAKVALATCVFCALGCVAVTAAAQNPSPPPNPPAPASAAHWLTDEQTGCRAPDPDFADGDDIVWSATCANGVIDGPGTLTFLNKGQPQVTIEGTFRQGELLAGRASLAWPDGSKYDGEQIDGKFNGHGVFVSAEKDRLDGEWKDGALNGQAIVTWANGNRYEGGWLNGKAEGHGVEVWANGDRYDGDWDSGKANGRGVQLWANGQTYDGEWRDDQPNGTGKLKRADGTTYAGKFIDGHPLGLTDAAAKTSPVPQATASAAPTAAPTAGALPAAAVAENEPNSSRARLGDVEGKKLLSVDGSSIALEESEGGFTRAIAKPDGQVATTAFTFVNERMGTVADAADPGHVTGLFRMTDAEIDIDYSDGHSEVLRPGAGGVTLAVRSPDGQGQCMAWYPEGHAFSDQERRAALADYAAKLGVSLKGIDTKSLAHPATCTVAAAAPSPVATTRPASGHARSFPRPQPRPIEASFEQPAAPQPAVPPHASQTPTTIAVRDSQVHPVDPPKPFYASSVGGQSGSPIPLQLATAAPLPVVMPSSPVAQFARAAVAAPLPAAPAVAAPVVAPPPPALQGAYEPDTSDPGASSCLSVASDGSHWGFKNGCGYSVQFAYCLKGDSEVLASCKDGTISGSAAPESFSALVADASMKEKGVDHQFRWVACGGGAGEVVPKLDGIDPPIGRCLRARTAAR